MNSQEGQHVIIAQTENIEKAIVSQQAFAKTAMTQTGIAFVEPDVEVHTLVSNEKSEKVSAAFALSMSFLSVNKLWARGINGQRVKVGVLDTGIDPDHPEFAAIQESAFSR